jgi:hypothetical protein
VSEFLKALREKTRYVARLLVRSERYTSSQQHHVNGLQLLPGVDNQHFSTQKLIKIVFHSLYGNCILMQDEYFCLQLMKHLMEMQFSGAGGSPSSSEQQPDVNDLRRLIRRPSCSFNILFKLYMTFSHSSQLFLTAALYEPISKMLNDEWYLDIDPDKALARFSNDDIMKK